MIESISSQAKVDLKRVRRQVVGIEYLSGWQDTQPATVTVTGTGLLEYGDRARAGELHIHRMDVKKQPVRYVLHLLWLTGRKLTDITGKPLPPSKQAESVKTALRAMNPTEKTSRMPQDEPQPVSAAKTPTEAFPPRQPPPACRTPPEKVVPRAEKVVPTTSPCPGCGFPLAEAEECPACRLSARATTRA